MTDSKELTVAVMITTRNRCDELRATLQRVLACQPAPDEILICADGCTDGTSEMVKQEFPICMLLENDVARGSVFSRDRLVRAAEADVVVSFDDDSYPLDRNFFSCVKDLFRSHAEVAVFSFPEIRDDGASVNPTKTPSTPPHLVSAYANCAAAMRRDVYLQTAGFPTFFGHMYEEPDFALQCYASGKVVRFEPTLSIRHHVSERQREPIKRHHLNARNELWSVWLRCPWPWLPLVSLFRVWRQFRYACSEGWRWALKEPVWWFSAFRGLPKCVRQRTPIVWKAYYEWMRLARNPITLSNSDPDDGP
jgi:glycosyltransferase involved in cell wall biosynthesis